VSPSRDAAGVVMMVAMMAREEHEKQVYQKLWGRILSCAGF